MNKLTHAHGAGFCFAIAARPSAWLLLKTCMLGFETATPLSPMVKIWFQNRRARERRDKEAQQRNQHSGVAPKPFQPLTIPTVTWSVPSQPMTSSTFAQFPGHAAHQDFTASAYLSTPFSMFAGQVAAAAAVRKPGVDLSKFSKESPRGLVFLDSSSRGRPSVGDASSEESS
ncbi:hypothetical protein ElyMa_005221300 [Elysia marginata]|uniref:Homeobox domain-containing protein n=1 Tax=Elysia marginata TaxID=1093978 RepID=A0AAV4JWC4_9GAST|nr:hypothetical protein ElyMa_005221300 [Elysia marginata]